MTNKHFGIFVIWETDQTVEVRKVYFALFPQQANLFRAFKAANGQQERYEHWRQHWMVDGAWMPQQEEKGNI